MAYEPSFKYRMDSLSPFRNNDVTEATSFSASRLFFFRIKPVRKLIFFFRHRVRLALLC